MSREELLDSIYDFLVSKLGESNIYKEDDGIYINDEDSTLGFAISVDETVNY